MTDNSPIEPKAGHDPQQRSESGFIDDGAAAPGVEQINELWDDLRILEKELRLYGRANKAVERAGRAVEVLRETRCKLEELIEGRDPLLDLQEIQDRLQHAGKLRKMAEDRERTMEDVPMTAVINRVKDALSSILKHDISTLSGRVDAQAILKDVAAMVRKAVSAFENYDDEWDGFSATLSPEHSMDSRDDGAHDNLTQLVDALTIGPSTNASCAASQRTSSTDDLTVDQKLQGGVRTLISEIETLMSTVSASEGGSANDGSESVSDQSR